MAYDLELNLAIEETVAAGAGFTKVIDFGAASNLMDDVFYTFKALALTTPGTLILQTSVDNTTFTDVATVTFGAGDVKVVTRLPAFGIGRYLKAVSGTAAGTFTIDASPAVSITLSERNSKPYAEANKEDNYGFGNGDPVIG